MKFETVQIHFFFSECFRFVVIQQPRPRDEVGHPEIVLPWQRDVTTSPQGIKASQKGRMFLNIG